MSRAPNNRLFKSEWDNLKTKIKSNPKNKRIINKLN